MDILTFLDARQLFQGRALQLCKKVYFERFLLREVALRHLGILEDYYFEQQYICEVLGAANFSSQVTSQPAYEDASDLWSYMQKYPRKHSRKLFLFGYQALGGSEFPINANSPDLCHSIREQNNLESHFNKRNVRHLFIDGQGTYNSGPIDLDSKICVASGAFYHELDKENATVEELHDLF